MSEESTNRMQILKDKKPCYEIVFEQDFSRLSEELKALGKDNAKVCIITDKNVEKLYIEQIFSLLQSVYNNVVFYSIEPGEKSKNLESVQTIYEFLITEKFDRNDLLIALGGGVVGDLTGFIAATYLRGIDFVQVPTTLLAQVDSSIGGKTGVDFLSYKNMVGAFHMPKLVYTNLAVLKDLDDRQYYAGMAEVLKAGLIKDSIFYEWIISSMYEIFERDLSTLTELVKRSCLVKCIVVEKDPTEKGERALLNLGHTIGHAIEKYMNFTLLHGECVALGIVAAAYISWKKDMLTMEEYYEIRDMFVPFNLPISISDIEPDKILAYTKNDKKMQADKIKFILLKKVGKAVIDSTVTDDEILNAIKEIYYSEEDMNE